MKIGWKMRLACKLLTDEGGAVPSTHVLAQWVGPHNSTKYGYAIVKRCVEAGLVVRDPNHPSATPTGAGAVVLTNTGRKVAQP